MEEREDERGGEREGVEKSLNSLELNLACCLVSHVFQTWYLGTNGIMSTYNVAQVTWVNGIRTLFKLWTTHSEACDLDNNSSCPRLQDSTPDRILLRCEDCSSMPYVFCIAVVALELRLDFVSCSHSCNSRKVLIVVLFRV